MSKDFAILAMQRAIIRYIEARIPKDINKAQTGIVDNGKVHLPNGRTLKLDPVTDIYYTNGSRVACIIPDSGKVAAVVGVLA